MGSFQDFKKRKLEAQILSFQTFPNLSCFCCFFTKFQQLKFGSSNLELAALNLSWQLEFELLRVSGFAPVATKLAASLATHARGKHIHASRLVSQRQHEARQMHVFHCAEPLVCLHITPHSADTWHPEGAGHIEGKVSCL